VTEDATPETLGRYHVLRRLGAGGMAEVFLAKSTGAEGIEKILVVKRVLPTFARSDKFITMFLEEAKIATRLNHPNIVQVYAFEQVRDEFLLAMELVDGLDLGRLVSAARRHGERIPFGIAGYVAMEVAKGLDYAHKRRDERGEPMEIVHRDVSPQNVLLSYEGGVKVADFGIAKARMVSEETGVIKGKFSYMSPEQGRGEKVDGRSDVYSLGVLLAELLMNRPMYPGQHGLDVLEQVRHGKVTAPEAVDPRVPPELAEIVRTALAFDREDRFQTARAFAGAIGQFLHIQDEVVDGETLERFISRTVPREVTSPEQEARRGELSAATVATGLHGDKELRERRHVVVVAGRVWEDRKGSAGEPSSGDDWRQVLADIAFKADGVLSWPDGNRAPRFRFVLGLRRASVHDPLRAIQLAMDVIDALEGLSADLVTPLRASLGVSRGLVSTVRDAQGLLLDYEPIGSVVDVAERLAEAGSANEILAAGEIYRLVRRGFAFDEEGGREVMVGASTGLHAYRLRGARTREERAADALAVPAEGTLLGREEEIRSIREAYQEICRERRNAFLVVWGELGVGKTALSAAVLQALDPLPKVLHAECAFGTSDVPYAAVTDLLRAALDLGEDALPEVATERLRTLAATMLPKGRERTELVDGLKPLLGSRRDGDAEGGVGRSALIKRSTRRLIGGLAHRGPVVVWVDALQWADAPSLELLGSLMQEVYEVPVMVLLSSRPDPRSERLLSAIPSIELEELDDAARRALVRARFHGAAVPVEIETAVVDRAGGNPFFIIELIEALIDREAVWVEGEGDHRRVVRTPGVPIALPTTLEGVIAARLDELPEEERRAVRWLAVAGPGYHVGDLSKMARTDLGPALAAAENRALVRRIHGDTYAFSSAVIRHVAYDTADSEDRLRMHQRIGRWLARAGVSSPPARVARHLERAGDREAAADAYLRAAADARQVYSNREALRFYGRALRLLAPISPRAFAVHEAREQILRSLGRPDEQSHEIAAMRALSAHRGDPKQIAIAHARAARYDLELNRTDGVQALVARALSAAAECGEKGVEAEAWRLRALLLQADGDTPSSLEVNAQALACCGTASDLLPVRGSVLVQRSMLLRRLGRLDEALAPNAEAIVIFRRLQMKRDEAAALGAMGVTLASIGEWEDAATSMRASIALDRQTGDRLHLGRKLANVGQLAAELGDYARAIEFLRRAEEVFDRITDDESRADALSAYAEILVGHGEGAFDEAAACLDRARRIAERIEDRYDLARERIVRAQLEVQTGRLENAEKAARSAVEIAHQAGLVVYEVLARAVHAESLARLGRHSEAREEADAARTVLDARTVERAERVHLAVARAYRLAGDDAEADRAFERGRNLVQRRLRQIRDSAARSHYLASPLVQSLQGGT
jgi:tetratricopeptide (TPR) repeat protein